MLDHPNERSLHSHPTPRTGGIAIFSAIFLASFLIVWEYSSLPKLFWLALSVILVVTVSFLDDRYRVEVMQRLFIHLGAASLLLIGGFILYNWQLPEVVWHWPIWIDVGLSLFFIVWMINLYNFMDGMDGFAAGMAVIGFGCFAVFGWLAGNILFFNLSLINGGERRISNL